MRIRLAVLLMFLMSFVHTVDAKDPWKEHRARHVLIYYKEAPIDFVKTVEKEAEDAYKEITKNLGFYRTESWSFDDRAKIYIYDDREDYIENSKQHKWSHGSASARKKTIRTFPTAHGFFDSTLLHELAHIILREFIGYRSWVPLWFDEGVAMHQERAKRFGSNRDVRKAMEEGKFIPLEDLGRMRLTSATDEETILLFYAEAASIIHYLITELGDFRFVQLCRNLKKGDSFETALKSAYGRFETIKELGKAWERYLE